MSSQTDAQLVCKQQAALASLHLNLVLLLILWSEESLWSAGVSYLSCVPSEPLAYPQLLAVKTGWENVLVLCKQLLINNCVSILFLSQTQNIALYQLLWRNLILFWSKPVQTAKAVIAKLRGISETTTTT